MSLHPRNFLIFFFWNKVINKKAETSGNCIENEDQADALTEERLNDESKSSQGSKSEQIDKNGDKGKQPRVYNNKGE